MQNHFFKIYTPAKECRSIGFILLNNIQYATIVFLDAPLVKRQRSLSIVSFLA